jgi:hypothetical protein
LGFLEDAGSRKREAKPRFSSVSRARRQAPVGLEIPQFASFLIPFSSLQPPSHNTFSLVFLPKAFRFHLVYRFNSHTSGYNMSEPPSPSKGRPPQPQPEDFEDTDALFHRKPYDMSYKHHTKLLGRLLRDKLQKAIGENFLSTF